MHDTAAHLVDRAISHVPIRQWIVAFPRRVRCHRTADSKLALILVGSALIDRGQNGTGLPQASMDAMRIRLTVMTGTTTLRASTSAGSRIIAPSCKQAANAVTKLKTMFGVEDRSHPVPVRRRRSVAGECMPVSPDNDPEAKSPGVNTASKRLRSRSRGAAHRASVASNGRPRGAGAPPSYMRNTTTGGAPQRPPVASTSNRCHLGRPMSHDDRRRHNFRGQWRRQPNNSLSCLSMFSNRFPPGSVTTCASATPAQTITSATASNPTAGLLLKAFIILSIRRPLSFNRTPGSCARTRASRRQRSERYGLEWCIRARSRKDMSLTLGYSIQ